MIRGWTKDEPHRTTTNAFAMFPDSAKVHQHVAQSFLDKYGLIHELNKCYNVRFGKTFKGINHQY